MKAYEYILSKQTQWALNRGIFLTGSKMERGRPAYTLKLDENLFGGSFESSIIGRHGFQEVHARSGVIPVHPSRTVAAALCVPG